MDDPIEVLLVGDDAEALEHIASALDTELGSFETRTATGRRECIRSLQDNSIDCVVSEYNLGETNGVALFEAIQDDHSRIPFILYTASEGDKLASKAMSIGLTDVVQKSPINDQTRVLAKRIRDAVRSQRTLESSQRGDQFRQGRKALREGLVEPTDRAWIKHETQYPSLFEKSLNGIAIHEIVTDESGDPVDYVFLDANTAFEELTGLDVAEIRGERATEVLPNLGWEFIEEYGRVALDKESVRFDQYSTPLEKCFEISAFPLPDRRFVTVFTDITKKQERTKEIRRLSEYRRVLSEVDEVLIRAEKVPPVLSVATEIIANSNLFECTFLTLDEQEGPAVICESESELHERQVAAFHTDAYLETVYEQGTLRMEDVTEPPFVQHAEPRPPHEGIALAISHQDKKFGILTVHFAPSEAVPEEAIALLEQLADDIAFFLHTQELHTERRRREREVRETKEAYEDLFHGINDAVFVHEDGSEFVAVNETACERLGYEKSELLEMSPSDIVPSEQTELVEDRIETIDREGTSTDEMTHVSESGELIPVEITSSRIEYFGEEANLSVARDITERKRWEETLKKRERLFQELHLTTQEFLTAETKSEIFELVVEGMVSALDYPFVAGLRFDDTTGKLQPSAMASTVPGVFPDIPGVEPGDNPIWEAYRAGETSICDEIRPPTLPEKVLDSLRDVLVVPIGKFGVVLAGITPEESFDDVDFELMELLTASAEAILGRIHRQRQLGEVSQELSTQKSRFHELEGLMDAIEAIQQRIAESETRRALETAVCEELVGTERIDFAWIGRPQTADIELSPSAWAGSERGYLDMVDMDTDTHSLPSQRAASQRQLIAMPRISAQVYEETWATEALSREWNSVISIPLIHDEVLYGVLTAFSRSEDAFDQLYETLLGDIGSILVNYLSILNMRYAETHASFVAVDFEITDPAYPLYSLARETGTTIRFDTVAETTEDIVRVLVTVLEGDAERVRAAAKTITNIRGADWFGDTENHQLTLQVEKPFLATEVTKHGGQLLDSVADAETARIRLSLPETVSVRPVVEWLTTQYQNIDLIAKKESRRSNARDIARPEEFLTERQFQLLRAAYFGGYYDTPKGVTGEDLASSFDISSSVVYNHLQAAHRTLLGKIFDSASDNDTRDI